MNEQSEPPTCPVCGLFEATHAPCRSLRRVTSERDYEAKARQSETNRADELAARVRHLENLAHDSLLYLRGLTDPKASPETLDGQARGLCEEIKKTLRESGAYGLAFGPEDKGI